MEIETKAWVSFARTSLVNDGQDENGRNFKTLVYALKDFSELRGSCSVETSTNLAERVTKSTICMLVCGVVTGCDKLDLHGDPSDCMQIPRVPALWSPTWICFPLLLSSSLVFLNPVKLISIISYRDEVWHARGKAWDWLLFLFLNAFFVSYLLRDRGCTR